jgi:hypothetical protein
LNSFEEASLVSEEALKYLLPFIAGKCDTGYVLIDKGQLAEFLQKIVGDVIASANGRCWTIEIKAEWKFTGNFFLELFSNRNLDDPASHAMRGSTVGWLYTLRCDLLFYYFHDVDELYILRFFPLKQWAFGSGKESGLIQFFEQKSQQKYYQRNDTWGAIVPIDVLPSSVLIKKLNPRQMVLGL